MNRWMKNVVKDYFTFTKRERTGIFILVLLAIFSIVIPRFFSSPKSVEDKQAFQQELTNLKISIDSSNNNREYNREENYTDYTRPKNNSNDNFKRELFAFDPNTLDEAGWKRLGVREKTISTIKKFVAKGFRFKTPEDLTKIYGLRREDAQRLIPYVHIAPNTANTNNASFNSKDVTYTARPNVVADNRFAVIDINSADTAAFIALPGIGSKLAMRIVNFRKKLGGFYSIDQISETYGISDSTFLMIKSRLQCKSSVVKTININSAEVVELKTHPYIKWNIANAIVNYRKQHGNYSSVTDLRKIEIITDEVFNKISHYLTI